VHDTKWPIGPLHGADLDDSHFDGSMQLLRCLRPRHPLSVPRAKAVPTLANPVDAPCWVRLCSSVRGHFPVIDTYAVTTIAVPVLSRDSWRPKQAATPPIRSSPPLRRFCCPQENRISRSSMRQMGETPLHEAAALGQPNPNPNWQANTPTGRAHRTSKFFQPFSPHLQMTKRLQRPCFAAVVTSAPGHPPVFSLSLSRSPRTVLFCCEARLTLLVDAFLGLSLFAGTTAPRPRSTSHVLQGITL
jgi:hypothetical protein